MYYSQDYAKRELSHLEVYKLPMPGSNFTGASPYMTPASPHLINGRLLYRRHLLLQHRFLPLSRPCIPLTFDFTLIRLALHGAAAATRIAGREVVDPGGL